MIYGGTVDNIWYSDLYLLTIPGSTQYLYPCEPITGQDSA